MQKTKLRIKKLDERAIIPTYGTANAAGADLYAVLDENVTLMPGETKLIKTGLAYEIPEGYVGLLFARDNAECPHNIVLSKSKKPTAYALLYCMAKNHTNKKRRGFAATLREARILQPPLS